MPCEAGLDIPFLRGIKQMEDSAVSDDVQTGEVGLFAARGKSPLKFILHFNAQ
jgi:hypothetical protein